MSDLTPGLIITDGHDILRAMPQGHLDAYAAVVFALSLFAHSLEQQVPGFGEAWLRTMAESLTQAADEIPRTMKGSRNA